MKASTYLLICSLLTWKMNFGWYRDKENLTPAKRWHIARILRRHRYQLGRKYLVQTIINDSNLV